MAVPAVIKELIERFSYNFDAYRSGFYNETQVRREFIDPMFKALSWDIDNEQGCAEQYKDVIHEDAIKIGGVTKAPDYCFRIGGARKFFLEAKKPSINIESDIAAAFQIRRYAWTAKLPLSILTDFEEFAVYDCRIPPNKTDKASTARIQYLNFKQYAERWDEIAGIFSREAILKGAFDKYVESTKCKKGTQTVDSAFLSEIESWRETLAKNIAIRNKNLSQRELNFAVQHIIDRIIFLRICEDRGIEPYGQLQGLLNGLNVYRRMIPIFTRADQKYNSGLFHFTDEKNRATAPDKLTPSLEIDDKTLKSIIGSLYYPDSPYEFSVFPADILGHVYEQFLGKVIRLTAGHQAKVEEKPEVKKAGGVYYTPTYIVDYIVKNTVGKLLEGKTPADISGKRGAPIRILDPACGSGSFLLGAYQYLLDWHRDYYAERGNRLEKKLIYQGPGGEWRMITEERKRILLTHIFGVDIDPQAVEVTKLSLLLKVLEGENIQTLSRQLDLLKQRALPDLGYNIKCGNSLISPDFYQGRQMSMLDDEERYRINVFDWNAEFPDVFKNMDVAQPPPAVIGVVQPPSAVIPKYEYRRNLPHLQPDNKTLFVTFSTWKRQQLPESIRDLVLRHCLHYHGLKIFVHAVVVMPDHVHMIFTPLPNESGLAYSLAEIMNGIKGASAHSINKALGRRGKVWQDESFDHVLRSDESTRGKAEYICQNPVRKGLAKTEDDYPWLWREWIEGESQTEKCSPGAPAWEKSQPRAAVLHQSNAKESSASEPGFDVVIGNPPYVRQETLGQEFKEYVQRKFAAYAGTADLYVYFIEKSNRLLREGGFFGMICSNKFMRANYGKALRAFLAEKTTLKQIVDFGELPVFQSASTFPAIILTHNSIPIEQRFIYAPIKRLDFQSLTDEVAAMGSILDNRSISGENWTLAKEQEITIFEKMKKVGIPLGEYVKGKIYRGVLTGLNEAFVIDRETRDRLISEDPKNKKIIKPFVVGDDIRKYHINFKNKYLILIPNGWTKLQFGDPKNAWFSLQQTYPVIAKYLEEYKEEAEKRWDKGEYWWELRPCDYYGEFEKPKIIYPDIAKESRATFDHGGLYFGNTVYFIPTEDIYLLGLMNSRLMFHYFKRVATVLGDADKGGRLRWFRQDVQKLPIRTIDFSSPTDKPLHNQMVSLVETMLDLHKKLAGCKTDHEKKLLERQIAATDDQIDLLVYELYTLTKEEIAIVEGKM